MSRWDNNNLLLGVGLGTRFFSTGGGNTVGPDSLCPAKELDFSDFPLTLWGEGLVVFHSSRPGVSEANEAPFVIGFEASKAKKLDSWKALGDDLVFGNPAGLEPFSSVWAKVQALPGWGGSSPAVLVWGSESDIMNYLERGFVSNGVACFANGSGQLDSIIWEVLVENYPEKADLSFVLWCTLSAGDASGEAEKKSKKKVGPWGDQSWPWTIAYFLAIWFVTFAFLIGVLYTQGGVSYPYLPGGGTWADWDDRWGGSGYFWFKVYVGGPFWISFFLSFLMPYIFEAYDEAEAQKQKAQEELEKSWKEEEKAEKQKAQEELEKSRVKEEEKARGDKAGDSSSSGKNPE